MNNSVAFILFSFLLTVWTCSDDEVAELIKPGPEATDSVVTYIIPAGSHSSNTSAYDRVDASAMKFRVRFDSSAIYTTANTVNQADINKLYGRSDCGSAHHNNSARFGWRWFDNSLQLWAYSYVNGERNMKFITAVPLNTYVACEILFTASSYEFGAGDVVVTLPRHCQEDTEGYRLYPYFGGDETAPHKVTIRIQDLRRVD